MLGELHSHRVAGNSETCKVFLGQFMPGVSGWDVQMPDVGGWDFFARGETLMSGDPWLGRQSTHGAQLGFWSFSSFVPLMLPSSVCRQVQNIHSSKLYFRYCNVISKSTRGCGTSTLCLISQGVSSKIVSESRDESLWMRAALSVGPWTKAVAVSGASTLCLFGDFLQWRGSTVHCTKNTELFSFFTQNIQQ